MNNLEIASVLGGTIAAITTPLGYGGIGIIRISGVGTTKIAMDLLGHLPKPRYAKYLRFLDRDGESIDEGIALYFPAPHSFTGEDVLELQGHGGPVVLDRLLRRVLLLGARLARPGEFSERAFLNGKLDLTQAEAIADLIHAESEEAARAAICSLQGGFSKPIAEIRETLISLRTWLEASIDFSDETIDFLKDSDVQRSLYSILHHLQEVKLQARQGALLQDGIHIVIAGPPNAGKSSLLNRLSGQESAIVTELAGTTRDVIREKIQIDGLPIHVVDTAGLRVTEDVIEKEGIRRALAELDKADHILWIIDDITTPVGEYQFDEDILSHGLLVDKPLTLIRNKIDVRQGSASLDQENGLSVIRLSAKTGEGLPLLCEYLKTCVGYNVKNKGGFSARRRHVEALDKAEAILSERIRKLEGIQFPELLAQDLSIAQNYLDEITGKFTTDDLLGRIFSSFCIGK